MTEWIGKPLRDLDEIGAFAAMRAFLEALWERGGRRSDDIATRLSSIDRGLIGNHPPLAAAQWSIGGRRPIKFATPTGRHSLSQSDPDRRGRPHRVVAAMKRAPQRRRARPSAASDAA